MKFKELLRMLSVVLLTVLGIPSCVSDMDEEGQKTTGYKEYELTVAFVKLPGVLTSSGYNFMSEVFAVKRDESSSSINPVMSYDVLISRQFPTNSNDGEKYLLWLFKDLTAYYQIMFPEANVKAVSIRYTMRTK
ncbi:MAG: hypothetical protein K2H72_04340 [Muribaculaceae bacterium]|nr:hypothetical protein [Muribaculaceae bacterium]